MHKRCGFLLCFSACNQRFGVVVLLSFTDSGLTQNVNPDVYDILSNENLTEIKNYIEAPMTATRFSDTNNQEHSGEQITAELIYYQMIALNIPFECRKWHLNKLLTLIKVCSIKNQPPKKRSTREIMWRNSALNAARRKRYNTRG